MQNIVINIIVFIPGLGMSSATYWHHLNNCAEGFGINQSDNWQVRILQTLGPKL